MHFMSKEKTIRLPTSMRPEQIVNRFLLTPDPKREVVAITKSTLAESTVTIVPTAHTREANQKEVWGTLRHCEV
jgi:hypothetical protein